METEEDCRGCIELVRSPHEREFCKSGVKPSFTMWCKEIRCPCETCLVKGVCQEECDDMKKYCELFCVMYQSMEIKD